MYTGKLVFSQLMDHLPWDTFHRYVKRYNGNHKVKSFFCAEQYRCMAFAQLTYRVYNVNQNDTLGVALQG